MALLARSALARLPLRLPRSHPRSHPHPPLVSRRCTRALSNRGRPGGPDKDKDEEQNMSFVDPTEDTSTVRDAIVSQAIRQATDTLVSGGAGPLAAVSFLQSIAEAKSQPPTPVSVTLTTTEEWACALAEEVMCFGATAVGMEDAHAGTAMESPMFSTFCALDGDRSKAWPLTKLVIQFPGNINVTKVVGEVAQIIGMDAVPELKVTIADTGDWVERVQESFQPIRVCKAKGPTRPALWIVPSWVDEPLDEDDDEHDEDRAPSPPPIAITLYPGLAFGTGEHPTTQLCLQLLYETILENKCQAVVDYGCGSGVLAIAALRLGCSQALATDIDPSALSATADNAELNGIEMKPIESGDASPARLLLFSARDVDRPGPTEWTLDADDDDNDNDHDLADDDPIPESALPPGGVDVVVANILKNPLVQLKPRLVQYLRPGGVIILSGILCGKQAEEVKDAYQSLGMSDLRIFTKGDWAAVVGRKAAT